MNTPESLKDAFRALPSMHRLLEQLSEFEHELARFACEQVLDALRESLLSGDLASVPAFEQILSQCRDKAFALRVPSLRPVMNGTGILLHTNLGRAVLPHAAVEAVRKALSRYTNLELSLDTGQRASRQDHLTGLLRHLTGAEDALVVNNCAAATLLVLSGLCRGKGALVSRGELVEIGGGFRVPDVMAESGARLIEVGTTNQTHLKDYAQGFAEDVAMVVKVHRSNFAVVGHTAEVSLSELYSLSKTVGKILFYDAGSAALAPVHPLEAELSELVAQTDVLSISADKTLGGPQAGIILGKSALVAKLKAHPLARAMRVDKAQVAALEAILRLYRDGRTHEIPLVAMARYDLEELRRWGRQLSTIHPWERLDIDLIDVESQLGGGSDPRATLPSVALAIQGLGVSAESVRKSLLKLEPPVIARIANDRCLIDLRTILKEERHILTRTLIELENKLPPR